MLLITVLLSLLLNAAGDAAPTTAPATMPAPAWEKLATHEFAVATCTSWEKKPNQGSAMILHLGEETQDASGQSVKLGMTLERYPDAQNDAATSAAAILQRFKADPNFKLIGEPETEEVVLADGVRAVMVTVEATRPGDRRTAIAKLVVADANLRWVVSGFVVAPDRGGRATRKAPGFQRMVAHLKSFTCNPDKFDPKPIQKLYETP